LQPADGLRDAGGSGAASSFRGISATMPPGFDSERNPSCRVVTICAAAPMGSE